MPTKNPRINLTLDKSIVSLLAHLAEQEHVSIASLAKELMLEALERREDKVLSLVAEVRDTKKAKRIKHSDVWK